MPALTGDYPPMAMVRRRPTTIWWVLPVRSALVGFEQRSTSVRWLLSTLECLEWEWPSPGEVHHPCPWNHPLHLRVGRLWVRHLVVSIPHQDGTQATGYKLTSGQDEDLGEGHGVSVYSNSLLEEGISSSSSLSSFSLSSLVDRLVALDFATALLLGVRVFLLAISKLMDEVCWKISKRGRRRKGECPAVCTCHSIYI